MADTKGSELGSVTPIGTDLIIGIDDPGGTPVTKTFIVSVFEAALDVTNMLNAPEADATADQTNAEIRTAVEAATDSNVFTDADHTKLDAVEALADVTDTGNVTSADALMDSELADLASIKLIDQGLAVADSPEFAALNIGDAADTTITRVQAGVIAVEGEQISVIEGTETLLNKSIVDALIEYRNYEDTTAGVSAHTLVAADQSSFIEMNNASAQTLTIPANAAVPFPIGTVITVYQMGAGITTILGDTGVTLQGNGGSASAGSTTIQVRYGVAVLYKRATDVWVVSGDIAAVS